MDKAEKFLIKIQNKNQLNLVLKEKKAVLSKMRQHPEFIDEINNLKEEIDYIKLELENL